MAKTRVRSTRSTLCVSGSSKLVSQSVLKYSYTSSNNVHATGVIILTTQVLALGLRKMRQPKVIAEVIGGILLGMFVIS